MRGQFSKRKPRLWRRDAGQSLIEFAIAMPVLLLLLMGVIEMGRFAFISILVGNAARAGAAFGAQNLANSVNVAGIQQAADNDFQNNGQDVSLLNVAVTEPPVCGCDNSGAFTSAPCNGATSGTCLAGHWVVTVSVNASGTFNSIFNYPGVPSSIAVSRTSTLRVAQN